MVGNLVWKADFSEINFERKFYLSEKCHLDIRIYSGTPLARPPTGRHSTGRFSLAGWSRHSCIPKGFMYYRDHFISTIVCLIERYLVFVLSAAIVYRFCTIKSHHGKSRCRQYKFQKSLQYEFVTSHWHLLHLHSRLHPCIHDASGQRDQWCHS